MNSPWIIVTKSSAGAKLDITTIPSWLLEAGVGVGGAAGVTCSGGGAAAAVTAAPASVVRRRLL